MRYFNAEYWYFSHAVIQGDQTRAPREVLKSFTQKSTKGEDRFGARRKILLTGQKEDPKLDLTGIEKGSLTP